MSTDCVLKYPSISFAFFLRGSANIIPATKLICGNCSTLISSLVYPMHRALFPSS